MNDDGSDMVEWIVVAALIIVILAPALVALFGALQGKFEALRHAL